MRNILRLTALVCLGMFLACLAVPAARAYNLVQSNSNSGGGTSLSVTFSNANAAGNLIIVTAGWPNGGTATVSDSNNNAYVSAVAAPTTTGLASQIWYASNVVTGSNTVTVTFSQWDNAVISIFEYSGLATSSALDATNASTGNSNSPSTGNISTAQANELIFASAYGNSGGTLTAGSGYAMEQYTTFEGTHLGSEDMNAASTGTYDGTFSDTNAWTWTAQIASFKAGSGGGGSGAPTCGISGDTTNWIPGVNDTNSQWDDPPVIAQSVGEGGSYVDPKFGCTVVRLTNTVSDASNGDASSQTQACPNGGCYLNMGHYYSTLSPMNEDDTLIFITGSDGSWRIKDTSGNLIVPKTNMPGPNEINDGTILWDASQPYVFYYTKGAQMLSDTINYSGTCASSHNCTLATPTVVHDFSQDNPSYPAINFMDAADLSQDGAHVVIVAGDNTGNSPENVFDYDFQTNTEGPVYTTTTNPDGSQCVGVVNDTNNGCLHKLSQTPDNNVLIAFYYDGDNYPNDCPGTATGGQEGWRLWNGSLVGLQNCSGHVDTGDDMNGNAVFLETGNSTTFPNETSPCPNNWGLDVRQIYNTSSAQCLINNPVQGIALPQWHVSYRGSSEQPWAAVSFFGYNTGPDPAEYDGSEYEAPSSSNWITYQDEITVVRIDANNSSSLLYRLARAYTRSDPDYGGGYSAQPQAAISRDGKYIIFNSNMAHAGGCPGTPGQAGGPEVANNCSDAYLIKIAN